MLKFINENEKSIVAFFSILISLSFGLSYGDSSSNHPVYLISGLKLTNSQLLLNDWWASNTTHYHQLFAILVTFLDNIDYLAWGLAILNFACIFFTFFTFYLIIKNYCKNNTFIAWLFFIVLFFGFSGTKSIAVTYFFSPALQPSNIATCFLVLSIYYFLKNNYIKSGIAVAISGAFHANFLILAFPFLGLSHLLLGTDSLFKRLLQQFTLLFLVFINEIPNILDVMGMELTQNIKNRANDIFINIAVPFHYKPNSFLIDFIPLAGWSLSISPIAIKYYTSDKSSEKNLSSLHFAFTILIIISALLTTIIYIDPVARLFAFRMAPFLLMLSNMLLAIVSVSIVFDASNNKAFPANLISVISILLGVLLVSRYYWYFGLYLNAVLLLLMYLMITATWVLKSPMSGGEKLTYTNKLYSNIFIIFLTTVLLTTSIHHIKLKHFGLISQIETDEYKLFEWAKKTDSQSIFLIPPSGKLSEFRLRTERAVVVDWKAIPFRADEIILWYERINDVSGQIEPDSQQITLEGYRDLSVNNLILLRDKYNASHFVQYKTANSDITPENALYQNDTYFVISLKNIHSQTP